MKMKDIYAAGNDGAHCHLINKPDGPFFDEDRPNMWEWDL